MGVLWSLLWAVLCTALILALAYGATKMVASGRWKGLGGGGKRAEHMEILSQLTLGRDQRLTLVRCGQRCLLLGVTAGRVEVLLELSAEEAESLMAETPPESAPAQRPDFSQAMSLVLRLKREKR